MCVCVCVPAKSKPTQQPSIAYRDMPGILKVSALVHFYRIQTELLWRICTRHPRGQLVADEALGVDWVDARTDNAT